MTARTLDGVATAAAIKEELRERVAALTERGVVPGATTPSGKAKLSGDVAAEVADIAGCLSPNPGGVGQMTRAMLVANVVDAAERADAFAGV